MEVTINGSKPITVTEKEFIELMTISMKWDVLMGAIRRLEESNTEDKEKAIYNVIKSMR